MARIALYLPLEHSAETLGVWTDFIPGIERHAYTGVAARVQIAKQRVEQLKGLVSIYKFLCVRRLCTQLDAIPPEIRDATAVRHFVLAAAAVVVLWCVSEWKLVLYKLFRGRSVLL